MSDHGKSSSSSHSSKRRETEEERAIRKEKERRARENETEEERKIRKEKERKKEEKHTSGSSHDRKKETEEERRIRKEKEASGRRRETEEERSIRKEKERRERENETEEERKIRKDKERKREEEKRSNNNEHEKRKETEEERKLRKEKEKKERERETEEERRIRKEREKESSRSRKETEERIDLKEKEVGEKMKCKDENSNIKTEIMELDEDYFKREEARLAMRDEKLKKDQNEENSSKEEEPMEDSDDDVPLAQRKKPDITDSGEDSDIPLAKRKKVAKKRKAAVKNLDNGDNQVKHSKRTKTEDDEEDYEPKKESKKGKNKDKHKIKEDETEETKPTKKLTKKEKELEEEKNVWKWWEEKENDKDDKDEKDAKDKPKWKFLEHNGPLLAPEYEPLPPEVRFWYDGKIMRLSEVTEEVCTFYAKMLDHDYTTKDVFNKNFMKDWRKSMTEREREKITDLSKCDFTEIHEHFKKLSEERKARSKEEKQKEKEKNAQIQAEYGMCTLDGHQEKIGNYRVEPPGLFRGRGEHPKQGMVKRRVPAEDIIINCSKNSKYPKPPPGHKWKEVKHDNTVTWLASWTENIQGGIKYVMLNPSSKLKGEKDMDKYEKARRLKGHIDDIRKDYQSDYKEKEMRLRQRAVALYFIDKLALRAGNEKDEKEEADTVGCCSLRCEHIELYEEKDGNEWVVEFDFLGKDSIRYYNVVPVEKRVWKNLKLFKREKGPTDELFDRLNTTTLNDYLKSLMPGLSAKVFRTYNASITLQEQLDKLTNADDNVAAKMLSYNRANREVAVLCNHQRAVPKTHDKSMANLMEKIEKKEDAIKEAEKLLKAAKKAYKNGEDRNKESVEKRKKAVERLKEQLEKLEIQKTDKDENKTIALGTSKLNYLDPRISVAWCKKHDVPIEKVYNKTQRQKFMWAINMAGPDFVF